MFTKSPYQVMRTYNTLLLDDCMFENPSRSTYTKWLTRFYKEFNKAKRKYRDWDNDYINVDDVIGFDFCDMFTTRYFTYHEWTRFENKLYNFQYKLTRYNQMLDNRDIKLFYRFMQCFLDQANDEKTELYVRIAEIQNIIIMIDQSNMFTMRIATIQNMMMVRKITIQILKGCIAMTMMSWKDFLRCHYLTSHE